MSDTQTQSKKVPPSSIKIRRKSASGQITEIDLRESKSKAPSSDTSLRVPDDSRPSYVLSPSKKRKIEVDRVADKFRRPIAQMKYIALLQEAVSAYNAYQSFGYRVDENTPNKYLIPVLIQYLLSKHIPQKSELPSNWIEKQYRRFYSRLYNHTRNEMMKNYTALKQDLLNLKYKKHEDIWLRGKSF